MGERNDGSGNVSSFPPSSRPSAAGALPLLTSEITLWECFSLCGARVDEQQVASLRHSNALPLPSRSTKKPSIFVVVAHLSLSLSTSTPTSLSFRHQLQKTTHPHSFQRGLQRKSLTLIKKLRAAKRVAAANNEKPDAIRTHLRNTVIVPEMIGSVIGVYNGKTFNQVEVKPDMVGHYLGEFSISYKPVKHGKAGIGSTTSSRFIPLK